MKNSNRITRVGFRQNLSSLAVAGLALWAGVTSLHAVAPPATTTIRYNGTDFEGRSTYRLEWDAESNLVYRIQSRTGLETNTPWTTFELVQPTGARGAYDVSTERGVLPPDAVSRGFFQVLQPQAEIFRIEPAVLGTNGGTVYLFGQGFGTNISVRIGSLVLQPTALEEGRHYTVTIPLGGLGEGPQDVVVLDGTNVVATQAKLFSVTGQPTPVGGGRLSEPPVEPPASPMAARGKKLYVGNLPFSASDQRAFFVSKKGYDYYASKKGYDYYMTRVSAANGECVVTEEDLSVPGRGLDFTWTRTYRSRNGTNTVMGHNWDHSYNIRISALGTRVVLFGGNSQSSDFFLGSNGVYTANERFEDGTFSNGVFTLTFPDTGKWIFNSLSNSTAPGAVARIEDRNGNALTFNYDASSRLSEIIDTLGRTNRVAYNGQGRVASITDFSGRACTYTYWRSGEAGGGNGDLRSITTPPVTGTANTNDFPLGKTTTCTYSLGFADNRLNHNLRTITDPAGKMLLQATYADSFDPADVNFDRVTATTCGANPPTLFTYLPQSPTPSNSFAVMKTIVNDPVGNVTIDWFDSLNRNIVHRDLAARAVPGTMLTESTLPTAKLRDSDPDFWQTRFTWNLDSLCTRVVWPEGNRDEYVYERDLNPACSARHKADIRALRQVAYRDADDDGDGLVDSITSYFQHDPRFGSGPIPVDSIFPTMSGAHGTGGSMISRFASGPRQTTSMDGSFSHGSANAKIVVDRETGRSKGFGFVISSTDPRGNVDHAEYDAQGNCTRLAHSGYLLDASDTPVNTFEYNSHGQLTAVVNAADANGFTRRDEITYYDSGAQNGYMREWIIDAVGPTVRTTRYDYDAVGNVAEIVDPRGNTNRWIYNALNQVVKTRAPDLQCSGCVSYERTFFYDASDNLVRVEQDDRDANGVPNPAKPTWTTLYDYDALNRRTLVAHELAHTPQQRFATNRFVYDALNNVIEEHSPEAVNGNQPSNFVRHEYDTRNLPLLTTRAPGTADSSTSQWGYDGNGRCVRAEHGAGGGGGGGVLRYTYDSLGLVVTVTDPLGNTGTSRFNKYGSTVFERVDGELNDGPGSTGNRRLSETRYEYDSLNRLTRRHVSFFDVFTELPLLDGGSTTTFTYAPNGACRSVKDDNGRTTRYDYDTSGRLARTTDPRTNTVSYTYDQNGNVLTVTRSDASDLSPEPQIFTMRYEYDALDRCVTDFDNIGNTNRYAFDSRGNAVSTIDPRGNETVRVFDGLSRCVRTDVINGLARDRGITINTSHVEYDTKSRLISTTDGNSNVTSYAYDNLDRCVATTNADGTVERLVWSPRSNLISRTDPNGTVITYTYDANNRCVRKDIAPGAGVSSLTTFETFEYDGMSRCVMASNDVSMLNFDYDSMGNREKAKQDCVASAKAFDGVGNCTSMTYPSGLVVTYGYNAVDEVSSVSAITGKGLPPVTLATFAYEGPGRAGRMTRNNGVNTRWNWNGQENSKNAAGDFGWRQVSAINHQAAGGGEVIDRRIAAFDRDQNKTRRQQAVPFATGVPTLTTNIMAYDALNRMSSFSRNRASVAYTKTFALDGNGNRQTVSSNGVVETYTMDNATPEPADFQMNQYTGTPFGNEQHDRNGNLVSVGTAAGSTQFTYDYANRLVLVERSAGPAFVPVASFTYDAFGGRIAKTIYPPAPLAPVTTQFYLDPDSDGDIIEEWVDGVARFFAVWPHMHKMAGHARISATGEFLWVHTDDLGNALAVTESHGAVVERYDYDDYGSPRFLTADGVPMVNSDGTPTTASPAGNNYLFRGMFWDGETGLYLTSSKPNKDYATDPYVETAQRYIDPKAGRATTRGADANAFTFAGNNPWSASASGGKKGLNAVNVKLARAMNEEGGRHTPFHNKVTVRGWDPEKKTSFTALTGGDDCDDAICAYFEAGVLTAREAGSGMATGRRGAVYAMYSTMKGFRDSDSDGDGAYTMYGIQKACRTAREAGSGMATGRRSGSIIILDNDGETEVARYNYFEAWPCRWKAPELNAKNSGHATMRIPGRPKVGEITLTR